MSVESVILAIVSKMLMALTVQGIMNEGIESRKHSFLLKKIKTNAVHLIMIQ